MSDNLLYIALTVLASIGGMAVLLILMTFLEPTKDLSRPQKPRR